MTSTRCLLLAALVLAGCRGKEPAPAPADAVAPIDDEERGRFRDAWVYVDGSPVRVLRYRELPPSLATTIVELVPGKRVMRFSLARYLESLGVDLRRARQVHVHGGRSRVSVFDPADVVRLRDKIVFQFTQQTRGKAQMVWPDDEPLRVEHVDIISAVAVYVDKVPPVKDAATGGLVLADGQRPEGMAYAPRGDIGGTRVYVDGRFAGLLRRPGGGGGGGGGGRGRGGTDAGPAETRPLWGQLAGLGVPVADVRHLQLVDDDLVGTLPGAALKDAQVVFPAGSRGRARVQRGAADGGEAAVSALLAWTTEKVPERALP